MLIVVVVVVAAACAQLEAVFVIVLAVDLERFNRRFEQLVKLPQGENSSAP